MQYSSISNIDTSITSNINVALWDQKWKNEKGESKLCKKLKFIEIS